MNARRGTTTIMVVLTLLSVPVILALVDAVVFHVKNHSSGTLVSSGETRDYVLHVPEHLDRRHPVPLVISMHGAAMWGAAQRETSQWDRVADRHGFIVVYPSGTTGNGPRVWREDDVPGLSHDVRFISDLIDTLRSHYPIDTTRIFANGLSNGGGMSFALSCTLSDRIAAVGMVGAAQLLPFSWCPDKRPVAVIAFHGTADRQAPYRGGVSWVTPRPFPNVQRWMAQWALRNRCLRGPIDSTVATDVTRRVYTNCANDASVVLYSIHGGGHTWPGGTPLPEWFAGRTSTGIDASEEMWSFFRAHPLSRP